MTTSATTSGPTGLPRRPTDREAIYALLTQTGDTLTKIKKWSVEFLDWCETSGLAPGNADAVTIERFRQEVGVHLAVAWARRKWAITAVVRAAAELATPSTRRTSTARARLDSISPRSVLGRAVTCVLAAGNAREELVLPTMLGQFLLWCEREGLAFTELLPAHSHAYRRHLLESGRKSPGEAVVVASRLIRELRKLA